MIATRVFGASGQPWMWRQVTGLSGFAKEVVCWERQNAVSQATVDIEEHVLGGSVAPYDTRERWLHRLRNLHHGNFYAATGKERSSLTALLASRRPDLILCNFGDIAMRMLPSASRAGIPLVAYFHGDFSFNRNRWYRWSLIRCLKGFSAIIVVTDAERQWLVHHGVPAENIHLIPCGAPTRLFGPRQRRSDDQIRFVMASRLSEDKGCDISIEAFARVAALYNQARLDIYGDGPTRGQLEALVGKLGLEARVRFHGYVDGASLARALPQHDVFIQHSRIKEGAPVAIVEAMACALPVVATAVGGIPDQVEPGRTGFLVAEGNGAGMSSAMLKLAGDAALRERLGREARRQAMLLHDADTQTRRLGAVLKQIIYGRPAHVIEDLKAS
jgi:glycosyltransferase involved in cell wall biosynthesis